LVALTRDRYDLAIRVGRVMEPNCGAVRLARGRRVVSGSPAYHARFGIPQTPTDLARHNCLALNMNAERRPWLFMHKRRTINVDVDGPLDCNDGNYRTNGRWRVSGCNGALCGKSATTLRQGDLLLLDDFVSPESDVMAVYPRNRYVPARVRQFISRLRAIYAKTLLDASIFLGAATEFALRPLTRLGRNGFLKNHTAVCPMVCSE
jgi:DNA-binding transcriptional LysR family regulator